MEGSCIVISIAEYEALNGVILLNNVFCFIIKHYGTDSSAIYTLSSSETLLGWLFNSKINSKIKTRLHRDTHMRMAMQRTEISMREILMAMLVLF